MTVRSFTPDVGPGEILPLAATRDPDKVALITLDGRFTYRELDAMSGAVAAALRRRGIGTGDVVSLYGQNCWQWIVAYHGALRAGAVVNPVNVMLTGPELAYVLGDCESDAVFCGVDQAEIVASVLDSASTVRLFATFDDAGAYGATPIRTLLDEGRGSPVPEVEVRAQDLAAIAYTSGTTGHPKGAMQSQQSILLNCALTATMHGRTAADVVVTALPAAHVYGNVAVNSTFLVGGTVALLERFAAATALRLIERERATMFEGVPAMYAMLLADPALPDTELTSLRVATVGGQTISAATVDAWQQRSGAPLIELWGMTEIAGLGATHSVHAPGVPGSIGVALPGTELRVGPLAGGTGNVPVGEPGELLVRGPHVMLGYFANPVATAETIADGWLRTGDVAYVDDTGHYFVVDRIKDVILTGGYNVYPAEIERVLAAHPHVAVAAVGRRPDPVLGELAVAYVVAKPGAAATEESILDFCRTRLAAYKRPRAVVFAAQLPTTSSGKLMRRRLAELDVIADAVSDTALGPSGGARRTPV